MAPCSVAIVSDSAGRWLVLDEACCGFNNGVMGNRMRRSEALSEPAAAHLHERPFARTGTAAWTCRLGRRFACRGFPRLHDLTRAWATSTSCPPGCAMIMVLADRSSARSQWLVRKHNRRTKGLYDNEGTCSIKRVPRNLMIKGNGVEKRERSRNTTWMLARSVGRMLGRRGSRIHRHEVRNRLRIPGDPLREPIARAILGTLW
jgi:hypothetical protein